VLSFRFKLVAYFSLLVLVPLIAGFFGVRDVVRQSETRRVDAELVAAARAAQATYRGTVARSVAGASTFARGAAFQRALLRRDVPALRALLAPHPDLTLQVGKRTIGRAPAPAARRVEVVARGKRIGTLLVSVPLGAATLQRIVHGAGLAADQRLVAVQGAGAVGSDGTRGALKLPRSSPADVSFAGHRFRAALTPLGIGRGELLVAVPRSDIDDPVSRLEKRLALGLFGLLILIALAAFLEGRSIVRTVGEYAAAANAIARGRLHRRVPVRGRDELAQLGIAFNEMAEQLEARLKEVELERKRLRDATLRFGEGLGASHDVDQLLRVIVESAVDATDATGGTVTGPSGETFSWGNLEEGPERIEWPLLAGRESFGKLVLVGEEFGADDLETAALLCGHAAVALENARLHRIVERQALVDGLTGLANRRHTEEALAVEIARIARAQSGQMALVLLDVDRFKSVNDRYGHPSGDIVLRSMARILDASVREVDTAGRWGGEEFALILAGTDLAGGTQLAERIRQAIETTPVVLDDGTELRITASFGVASLPPTTSSEELLGAADEALYAAKETGRNRVVASGDTFAVAPE
jgi:diguanylate cyclase (GGDEF)-like protein